MHVISPSGWIQAIGKLGIVAEYKQARINLEKKKKSIGWRFGIVNRHLRPLRYEAVFVGIVGMCMYWHY